MSFLFVFGLLVVFMLGLVIGSFINVLVYRSIETEEDWKTGRSRCDHCHALIKWYDNIPLFSYLILRGKCRACHQPISPSHLLVELLTGALFIWWYLGFAMFFQLVEQPFVLLQPLFWLLVGLLAIVIVVADIKYYLIPDWAVVSLSVLTIAYRLSLTYTGVMQVDDLVKTVIASLIVMLLFWSLWFLSHGKALGFGDVKLVLVLGLLVGWPKIIPALFLAFLTGAGVGIVLILLRKKGRKSAVPFGPFLILGSFLALVVGQQLLIWYLTLLGL